MQSTDRSSRHVRFSALAAGLALVVGGCASPAEEPTIGFYDLLGLGSALEPNPVDNVAELADRADIMVVGTVTGIEFSAPIMATPDPGDPNATYGGQQILATVQPSDGSDPLVVEFVYQFLPGGAVTSPGQVQLPDDEMVLALVENSDGSKYYCVADSQWCPLVWSGTGLKSGAWQGDDVPLTGSGTEQPSSIDDAVEVATESSDVEVIG